MRSLVICLVLGCVFSLSVCTQSHDSKLGEDERILAAIKEDDAFQEDEAKVNGPVESFEEDLMLAEADGRHFDFSEIAEEEGAQKDPKPVFKRLFRKAKRFVKRVGKKIKKVKSEMQKIGERLAKAGKNVIRFLKKRTICYRPYGCFNNRSPWNKIWNRLPQRPSKIGTKFVLFTRRNRKGKTMHMFNVRASNLVIRKKTIFIIHGWKETYTSAAWMRQLKDEFLKLGDFNVITVHWVKGAGRGYFQAAGNTRLVGAQVAYLIQRLHKDLRLCFGKVHLIGFSLGAQIAGFAGRRLREKGHIISRISGLDPAGPVFARQPRKARLDSTDARFVDVIHTSFLYFIGVKGRSGDIDFYVNGGGAQPGCGGKKIPPKCSHFRAVQLYIKSVNPPCKYRSYKCSRYTTFRLGFCKKARTALMGYHVSRAARGKYYLKTSGRPPYC
ncbi:pancreatic lipase-related protein 3-like [Rhopilema esculentum]|uniref:pancreatic lipase-related protein 3-like n=1 Tax=Rhopilema esculentum TaxID=499914 RepID=UPI0031D9B177